MAAYGKVGAGVVDWVGAEWGSGAHWFSGLNRFNSGATGSTWNNSAGELKARNSQFTFDAAGITPLQRST